MNWLLRQLNYRSRFRYWRRRAREAERHLNAEVWRNRMREDMFVSAAVMGSRGMVGIVPRETPAYKKRTFKHGELPVDPHALSGSDLLEFQTYWLPDAEAAGISPQQAKDEFYRRVVAPRRLPLNDDPYAGAN